MWELLQHFTIHCTQITLVFCFSRVLLQLPPCKLSSVRADSESSELDRVVGHLVFTTLNPSCPRLGHFNVFETLDHSGPRSGRFNISLSIPYTYFQTSNTDLTGRLRHQNGSRWPVTWAKPIVAEFVRYVRKLFLVKSDRRVLSNNPAPSSTALKAQVLQPLFYKLSHFLREELTSARRTGSARKVEVLKHSL